MNAKWLFRVFVLNPKKKRAEEQHSEHKKIHFWTLSLSTLSLSLSVSV
jgi:hypothetical protein